jgi:adenylate kinase
MKRVIIPLGLPGVGKGTQSALLAEYYGIAHFSTGEIIRAIEKQDTDLGRLVLSFNSKGIYTPDDIMVEIIQDRVKQKDCREGYIIDGFPRTLPQAMYLDKFLERQGESLVAIFYDAPEEVVLERIRNRVKATISSGLKPRSDDIDPASLKKRIAEFREKAFPVVNHYKEKGQLIVMDATQSPKVIFEESIFMI